MSRGPLLLDRMGNCCLVIILFLQTDEDADRRLSPQPSSQLCTFWCRRRRDQRDVEITKGGQRSRDSTVFLRLHIPKPCSPRDKQENRRRAVQAALQGREQTARVVTSALGSVQNTLNQLMQAVSSQTTPTDRLP